MQVNPFAYSSRHSKHTSFQTESEYNAAIIAACQENGIEVKGVTDHYRVAESTGLVQAARAARIFAFSGFEAVSKDGVHFLCLFDPDKDNVLERFIGECGIRDTKRDSPTGSLDSGRAPEVRERLGSGVHSRSCCRGSGRAAKKAFGSDPRQGLEIGSPSRLRDLRACREHSGWYSPDSGEPEGRVLSVPPRGGHQRM